MRYCPKHCGLIVYLDTVLLKLLLLSLYMVKRPVLPVELNLDVAKQNDLTAIDYYDLMMDVDVH